MRRYPLLWIPAVGMVLALAVALNLPSQTVNMGRTFLAPGAVRYANEAGTGTTLNKLAKLTGAPSTAIIAAITDTSGIVGIVVAGAGTTGAADIAVFGKASCVFDSATTAGHYVVNDTSTAGDCMDSGAATYPTSGQVIGIVTSTNGGAGTYEVDLSLGQPQAGGAGAGATISTGTYAALPGACTDGNAYLPTDSFYQILRCAAANVWVHFVDGRQLTPPILGDFAWINQGGATGVATYGGVYISAPSGAGGGMRILKKAAPATPYTITLLVQFNLNTEDFSAAGLCFRESGTGKLATIGFSHHNNDWNIDVSKFTNPTTFSAFYVDPDFRYLPMRAWLQISDDGVNRISRMSLDGKSFFALHTIARADFLTADEVCFFVNCDNATHAAYAAFLHWAQ